MKKAKIGLALGSGGARGWCHIGVLRGLEEMGVEPMAVAGTSMGALVGAAWAGGKLDELEAWVLELTPARFMRLMDVSLRSGGLVAARGIQTMLGDIGLPGRIEDFPRPFVAIATDMENGREIWLDEGPTGPAVRASAGIPGVMTPIHHEGHWLLDGGLTNPVPVSASRAQGAEIIIAVNPNAKPHGRIWHPAAARAEKLAKNNHWMNSVLPPKFMESFGIDPKGKEVTPNYFEVVLAALDTMTAQIRRSRLAGEPPHVLLNAAFEDLGVLELYRGAEAIEEGRRMVKAQEVLIREVCGL